MGGGLILVGGTANTACSWWDGAFRLCAILSRKTITFGLLFDQLKVNLVCSRAGYLCSAVGRALSVKSRAIVCIDTPFFPWFVRVFVHAVFSTPPVGPARMSCKKDDGGVTASPGLVHHLAVTISPIFFMPYV